MATKFAKVLPAILFLAGLTLVLQVASADVVTMTLTAPPPGNAAYGVYLSPYQATISGKSGSISVICDDFLDESVKGVSWPATVFAGSGDLSGTRMAALSGAADGALDRDYDAIAYLIPSLSLDQTLYSFAIWDIFSAAANKGQAGDAVESWLTAQGATSSFIDSVHSTAADALIHAPTGARDNLTIYSPPPTGTTPQEFVVVTPEASATAVLGFELSALLGGLMILRKRIRRVS
jgi:hypothetical protein